MADKPTVVIVPGAWQPPVFFEALAKKLGQAGFPAEIIVLTSVGGTETPLPGLDADIVAVRKVLTKLKEDGKKTLVLGHSSGGLSGSNAIEDFDVAGIIYMSAFMIPTGKSILEMLGGQPPAWDGHTGAFHDLSGENQAKWIKELTHTSASLFASPSTYEPVANGVKCGSIFLSEDGALPLPVQQQMSAQLGPEPATVTLKSSHCSHLSIPEEVVKAVVDLEPRLK